MDRETKGRLARIWIIGFVLMVVISIVVTLTRSLAVPLRVGEVPVKEAFNVKDVAGWAMLALLGG